MLWNSVDEWTVDDLTEEQLTCNLPTKLNLIFYDLHFQDQF